MTTGDDIMTSTVRGRTMATAVGQVAVGDVVEMRPLNGSRRTTQIYRVVEILESAQGARGQRLKRGTLEPVPSQRRTLVLPDLVQAIVRAGGGRS